MTGSKSYSERADAVGVSAKTVDFSRVDRDRLNRSAKAKPSAPFAASFDSDADGFSVAGSVSADGGTVGLGASRLKASEQRKCAQSRGSAASGASLGITTVKSSSRHKALKREAFRRTLAKARKLNKVLFRDDDSFSRLAFCGSAISDNNLVGLQRNGEGNVFSKGTARCANIWGCLNCANSIRVERAQFYQDVCREHLAKGGGILFITLTSSHSRDDDLKELWDFNQKGLRGVTSGGAWKTFCQQFGVESMLVTRETTHSFRAGWHNHQHALAFTAAPVSPLSEEYKQIQQYFYTKWSKGVERAGGGRVDEEIGVRVDIGKDNKGFGSYITKLGLEMALAVQKQGRKGSRTPYQIIADAANTGDCQDIALLRIWLKASKGRRAHTWIGGTTKSKEFRERFQTKELTEEEIVEQEQDGTMEGYIHADLWHQLLNRNDGVLGDVISAWESGGYMAANSLIRNTLNQQVLIVWNYEGLPILYLESSQPPPDLTAGGGYETNN